MKPALRCCKHHMILWSLMSAILLLPGCGKHSVHVKTNEKTFVVKPVSYQKTLHFTGSIQPIQESTLTSPAEGVLERIYFHFGQYVRKGQTVYTLNSTELQKQYNDTLTEYLKAKDNYGISKAKFTGTEDLWQAGLISKNNYMSEKSGLHTARLTLIQASKKLQEILEKMGENAAVNFSKLSFDEFDKVRLALTNKHNLIQLKASNEGVLLYPPKNNDDKSIKLTVGSAIKTGQVLALIGDLSGVSVNIDIPEIDLDKVSIGMPAVVHGVAFEKSPLKGKLVSVNAQASTSNNGALPSFTAVVEVPNLSKTQRELIKVGMSASIELLVKSPEKLYVPIQAVSLVLGKSMVKVKDKQGRIQERAVTTGEAQSDMVAVESGIHAGDVVVYDPSHE